MEAGSGGAPCLVYLDGHVGARSRQNTPSVGIGFTVTVRLGPLGFLAGLGPVLEPALFLSPGGVCACFAARSAPR